jgi:hypothetical protein
MAKRIRRKPTLGNRVPIVIIWHWPMIVHVFDSSRLACPKGAKGLQRVLTTGRSEFGDLGRLVAADLLDHAEPATPSLGSFPRRTSVVAIGAVSAGPLPIRARGLVGLDSPSLCLATRFAAKRTP